MFLGFSTESSLFSYLIILDAMEKTHYVWPNLRAGSYELIMHVNVSLYINNLIVLHERFDFFPNIFTHLFLLATVQFSCSVVSNFCDPMDCSMTGLPVHHQLLELTQTHVRCFSDAIQPSHSLSSPSHPTFNLSLHQGIFKWVSSSH